MQNRSTRIDFSAKPSLSTPHRGVEWNCSNLLVKENRDTPVWVYLHFGGPEGIRTLDPYNANVMRSQLRYGPVTT